MATVDTAAGPLWFETMDLTPRWTAEPETVLFLHGVGIDHGIWSRWWPILAARYRIVVTDMRGYGRSAKPPADYAWSMDGMIGDVLAVADAAGAEKFHFVGESFGGAAGYYLAIHRRERLRSLVACTAPHRGANIRGLPDWRRIIEGRGMEAWSESMLKSRFVDGAIGAAERRWFHEVQRACDPDSVLGQADMLAAADMTDGLPEIATPTLMIGGDSSPLLPPSVLVDTHARVPGAELRLFDGARHGVVLSHGEAAARTMLDFIDRRL